MSNIIADGILGCRVICLMFCRVVLPASFFVGVLAFIAKYREVSR